MTERILALPVKNESLDDIQSTLRQWEGIVDRAILISVDDCRIPLDAIAFPVEQIRQLGVGLGNAYSSALLYAAATGEPDDLILLADCGTWDPKEFPYNIDADVYLGYRVGESTRPTYKKWLTKYGGDYIRYKTGCEYADPTCGFRGYKVHILERLELFPEVPNRLYHAALAIQLHRMLKENDIRMVEFPCTHRRTNSSMGVKDILAAVFFVIKGGFNGT